VLAKQANTRMGESMTVVMNYDRYRDGQADRNTQSKSGIANSAPPARHPHASEDYVTRRDCTHSNHQNAVALAKLNTLRGTVMFLTLSSFFSLEPPRIVIDTSIVPVLHFVLYSHNHRVCAARSFRATFAFSMPA